MRNNGRFNEISRIVTTKDGICIAGIVCTMKYFVNNRLTGAEKDAAQPYSHILGTLYEVFLGYAFECKGNEIPIVDYSDLWQWFKEYLVPEWEKKSARTVEVDYLSWNKVKTAQVKNHGTEFYDSAISNDKELFYEYLSRSLNTKSEFAFCSNVENIQAVEDEIYTAVTTSASNVDKLKVNMERKRREREEQDRRRQEEQAPQEISEGKEKKTFASDPQEQVDKPTSQSIQTSSNSQSSMLQIILAVLSQILFSKWFWIVLVICAAIIRYN